MDPFYVFLLFGFVAVIAVGGRMLSGGMDRDRIRNYIASQGGTLLECNWSPFGRGWFGSKEERIYEIAYRDRDGDMHRATCKTSMLSGVYFTEDNRIDRGGRINSSARDESEIERLRRENAELKRRMGE